MTRKHIKRKQLFVDTRVQGAMLWRAVVYWICSMVTIVSLLLCWSMLTGPSRPTHAFGGYLVPYGSCPVDPCWCCPW